jgi:hypothetical protein
VSTSPARRAFRSQFLFPGLFVLVVAAVVGIGMLTTPRLASLGWQHYDAPGFAFDYPPGWRVVHTFEHAGLHGPTVAVAVGNGNFRSGCTATATGVSCRGTAWEVAADSAILAFRAGGFIGSHPWPSPAPRPGERWVKVAGRNALETRTATSLLLRLDGGPAMIEVHFGSAAGLAIRNDVQIVLSSWDWKGNDPADAVFMAR